MLDRDAPAIMNQRVESIFRDAAASNEVPDAGFTLSFSFLSLIALFSDFISR
jgi:hypothetical protein